ncbi:MAG TPA: glycoside hydrolase family 3 N-terminal domain-containing protein [Bryobacteraceae bacterium]|nr:glycoside hydrolase family 3 N-terminal domain-containing protein [Bryobacteraceae bacterium]
MRIRRAVLISLLAVVAAGAVARRKVPTKTAATPTASAVVRRWMRNMTLRDEVAQLIFIPFDGASPNSRSREYRKFVRLIRDTKVGGLLLVNVANGRLTPKAQPYALAAFLNRMQRLARVPLLVSADLERGASMRVDGTTPFPHAMAFGAAGDPALVRFEGQVTAREARALGMQWVLFPVADVNNNPDNPVINTRSFGENPQTVAAMVRAFIEGAHSDPRYPVLTTAKHFPGHGDTAQDSHLSLATVPADRDRLEHVELVPFRAAIEAGVDSVMTAHVAVPALAPADLPATLSPQILTGLLRDEMGFKGLVITDALEMGGVSNGYSTGEAAVRALQAGADVLLEPPDPDAALKAVVAAVESGRLTRRRIRESVARVLAAKQKLGLDRKRLVDLEAISDVIDPPEADERAQEIADRAVTLVRNTGNLVPLAAPERACYVVMAENRRSVEGQAFAQELRKVQPKAAPVTLDPSMPLAAADDLLRKLPACDTYAVAAFSSAAAYRGTLGLAGALPQVLQTLIDSGKPVALVALGNPYLLRDFPKVPAYLATFSSVPDSEVAAARALLGEITISGHLPISIPGLAQYGDGIRVPAVHPVSVSQETQ